MALVGGLTAAQKSHFSKFNAKSPYSDKIKAKLPRRKLEHDYGFEEYYGFEDYGMEDFKMDDMEWDEAEWDESNANGEQDYWELYLYPEGKDVKDYFTTFPSYQLYLDGMTDNQMTMWLNVGWDSSW